MNWEVEKLKAKGMRIKMLMILTFQLPLIKMGSNRVWINIKRKIRTSTLIFVFRIYICWELRPPPPSLLRRCVRSFVLCTCIMVWYIYIYISSVRTKYLFIYFWRIECKTSLLFYFIFVVEETMKWCNE